MKRIAVVGLEDGWSSQALAEAFRTLTGYGRIVTMDRVRLDLARGAAFFDGQNLTELDALVVKKVASAYSPNMLDRLEVLRFLEARGVPVFSRPANILGLVDRLSCTVSLSAAGLPMPPTCVTEDVDQALNALEDFEKAVFKPLYSTKARGMEVIARGPEARTRVEAFQAAGNPVMYLQKLLPPLEKDLGVTFIGERYLATYARKSSGKSWNTTTRSGGRYAFHAPSAEVLELAGRAREIFGLEFTCVDIAETVEGPVVFEVSAFGGFRGLSEGCGLDAAGLLARHILDKLG